MNVRILPDAEQELYHAVEWYEERERGVGLKLLDAYDEARRRVEERADRLPRLEAVPNGKDIRRTFLRRFPFMVVCELFPDEVVIIAFAHTSQRPRYWLRRIE